MLKTIFAIFWLLSASPLFSQNYITAAGLRVGGGIGITVQQSLWSRYTAEAQLQKGLVSRLTTFTVLLEQHHNILTRGADFYLGAGPHFGSYRATGKQLNGSSVFGLSAIGGLEFKLGNTLLSADLKPMINLAGGSSLLDAQTGISLRYVFIKAKKKEHKWMFWKGKQNKHTDKEDD